MSEFAPTPGMAASRYAAGRRVLDPADSKMISASELDAEFEQMLEAERAKVWDHAWREIQSIPRWWNPEDQYGEFDLQPLGPDETSEHGAYMAVREIMLNNPYRKETV